MMKRIIIICEGPTEQTFCNTILQPHMQARDIFIHPPLIKHSRGGIVKWPILKQQIEVHLKSDPTAFVTTLIDYYGLYSKYDFPSWDVCEAIPDRNIRMNELERSMYNDIQEGLRYRFIPYIQLHEFEGLLFNNIEVFYSQIPSNDIINKLELENIFHDYENPEMINNGRETSPSHRLMRIIRGYNKIVYGDILASAIGLNRMRNKSPRFNQWIQKLEDI